MKTFKIKLPAKISYEDKHLLKYYIKKINNFPSLTREKETFLFNLYKEGSNKSGQKIINAHLRMVAALAIKLLKNNKSTLPDLIQEGSLGLMDALKKFDPNKGRFSTISYTYAYNKILRKIMQDASVISIPESAGKREAFFKLNQAKKSLKILDNNLQENDINNIQKKLKINKTDILFMDQRMGCGDKSLNKTFTNNDGDEEEFINFLKDENYNEFLSVEDFIIDKIEGKKNSALKINFLYNCINNKLDKREKEIIQRRFLVETKVKLDQS